jgi:hypothetical protein
MQGSTAGILLNFCDENPPHRQAENRLEQARLTVVMKQLLMVVFYKIRIGRFIRLKIIS